MKDKDDLLLSILQSPVNVISTQNLINRKKKEEKTEDDSAYKVDYKFGKAKEVDEKYKERMVKKAQEDPDEVIIDTPRGPMTLAEAIKLGFNLETGEFEDDMLPPDMEDFGMDEAMMEELMMLMQNPEMAAMAGGAPGGAPMPPQGMPMPTEEEMLTEEGMEEEMLGDLLPEEEALI